MMDDPKKTQLPPGYYTACGGRINEPGRYPTAMYRGKLVYFCNKACLLAFIDNPDRFMSGEIGHPLELD
jgi:YHS domain-containing protein